LQKSHQFHLKLELPDGEAIKAEGIVQWISKDGDGPKGVGVHFEIQSKRDLRKIQRLLSQWESNA